MPTDKSKHIQSTKHTKQNITSGSSENEETSFKEMDSWKQSVNDSEKGSDSDNGSLDSGEWTKCKRCSLCKGKSSQKKVHPDINCAEKTEETIEVVTIVVSDSEYNKKGVEKEENLAESQGSGTQSGKQPTGLPPMAPKKLRKKSDRKSPRQRQRSKYAFVHS